MARVSKTVTINRRTWGKRKLRRENGQQCCLGFVARHCGVSIAVLDGMMPWSRRPNSITDLPHAEQTKVFGVFPLLKTYENDLIDVNDEVIEPGSGVTSRPDRELQIARLGKLAGVRFQFAGKY